MIQIPQIVHPEPKRGQEIIITYQCRSQSCVKKRGKERDKKNFHHHGAMKMGQYRSETFLDNQSGTRIPVRTSDSTCGARERRVSAAVMERGGGVGGRVRVVGVVGRMGVREEGEGHEWG
jgi:hypothetical protein